MLASSSQSAVTSPLMPTYNRFPLTIVKGKGSYVWDDQGTQYLDYTSGIATCNLGHVPESVKLKLEEQLQTLWHCSNLYHIPNQEKLARLLVDHSFGDQVFFCNSGAEANEASIKLARSYAQKELGKGRYEIVTFKQSFHGRTLATLSATGQEKIQQGFFPLVPGFRYLPFNDFEALDSLVSEHTCAVLLELVQGEGGVIPANPEWVKRLAQLCKEHNLLLMIDEIQTGMGRTGTLFAYQQYGIEPDVISLAKGLGSGFPIGAIVANKKAAIGFQPGSHGSTFGGNPLAATAGLATMEQFISTKLLDQAKELGTYLHEKLTEIKKVSNQIEEVRGLGLLQGIVIKQKANKVVEAARKQNLLLLTAGPDVVRILPPLTTTKVEIDQCSQILETIFKYSLED
ncbi:MAG TPA: acetylornithine transaminase [Bacillus sp. (in: firmicutes)]|uniref:acetylornithine transaminase n=1 Tax=Bacillus litorisediminis TaxID=2922713 RepID=UPI001FAC8C3C|nr:acetylornithine transaminase [Bacillus litorisediminis]HWO75766.1 acetylornithine transaminase [Bacillus sp. (in: firmicutes)]